MRKSKSIKILKINSRDPFKQDAPSTTMNETNQSSGVSESERVQYLASLQAVTTMTMIPAMVLLLLLSITGLVGNSLVLFVYTRRFTKTSTRVFVLAIAAFDLVANVIGIPGEIFDMFHIWDFDNAPLCRARLFFNAFSTLSSAMVLLAVAVTRYRKVCFPYGWQTSIKQARIASLMVALLGVLFSLPYVILNGRQTKKTPRPDIFGSECTTDDSYVNTVLPLLNNGFFVALFLVCCIPFTVLYVKIGVQAWRHSVHHGARAVQNSASYFANTSSAAGIVQNGKHKNNAPRTRTDQSGARRQSESAAKDSRVDFGNVLEVLDHLGGNGSEGSDRYDVVIAGGSVEVDSAHVDEFVTQLKIAAKARDKEALNGIKVIGVSTVGQKLDDGTASDEVVPRKISLVDAQTSEMGQDRGQTTVGSHLDGSIQSSVASPGGALGVDNFGFVDDNGSRPILFLNPTFACVDVSHPKTTLHFTKLPSCDGNDSNTTRQPTPVLTPNSSPQIRHPVVDHEITENRARLDSSSVDTVVFNTQTPLNDVDASLPCSHQQNEAEYVSPKQIDEIETSAETTTWVDIAILPRARIDVDRGDNEVDSFENSTPVSLRISCTNAIFQKNEWLRKLVAGSPTQETSRSEQTSTVSPDPKRSNELIAVDGKPSLNEKVEVRQRSKTDQKAPRTSKNVMSRIKSAVLNTRALQRFSNRPVSATGRRPLGRTTAMLIAISAVYIVGFVPYLILVFYRLMSPDRYNNMTLSEEAAYNFFLRTYFLNCAANPIIYGICDKNFRRECISLLKF